jgi:hypothetical protein
MSPPPKRVDRRGYEAEVTLPVATLLLLRALPQMSMSRCPRTSSIAGQRHRNALHFHRSLGAVTELDRQLECTPVARQRAGTVAANERAVGKKMVRKKSCASSKLPTSV